METQISVDGCAIANAEARKSHRKTISKEVIVNLAAVCMRKSAENRSMGLNGGNPKRDCTRFGAECFGGAKAQKQQDIQNMAVAELRSVKIGTISRTLEIGLWQMAISRI
jgi:hypothetical protein